MPFGVMKSLTNAITKRRGLAVLSSPNVAVYCHRVFDSSSNVPNVPKGHIIVPGAQPNVRTFYYFT